MLLQLARFRNTVFPISLRFPFLILLGTTYYRFASLGNSAWVLFLASLLTLLAIGYFPFSFGAIFYSFRLVLSKLKFRH